MATIPLITQPVTADKVQSALNALIDQINGFLSGVDPESVNITGGTIANVTINNSSIGATTPGTGNFTSLTASLGSINGDIIATLTAAQSMSNKLLDTCLLTNSIVNSTTIGLTTPAAAQFTMATAASLIGPLTGNADTATKLLNVRTIGGVSFDGTANITVATATGGFTVSGGDLALGANNLSMTGSLGSTGSRLTKGWFTDLQVTNAIAGSITGNAATATALLNARAIGGVNFDGTAAIVPQTIQVVDSGSATSLRPLFGSALTGNLQPVTDAGTSYNASTDTWFATGFNGALTGNADTATKLATARAIGIAGSTGLTATGVNFDGTAAINPALTGTLIPGNGGTGQSTYAIGDILYASASGTLSKLADVAAGSYLRSGGVTAPPVWSTTTLPNSATTGDLLYASASNVYSNLADVATGQVLISGGAGVAPAWSATPVVGNLTVNSSTIPATGIYQSSANITAIAANTLKACDFVSPGSSVCWLRIQGAATGGNANLIAQGETNTGMAYFTQGTGVHNFYTNLTALQAQILHIASAVNNLTFAGGSAAAVTIGAAGSATDIDILLTPKGAGLMRYNTTVANGAVLCVFTAAQGPTGASTAIQGWEKFKDASGTTRFRPFW